MIDWTLKAVRELEQGIKEYYGDDVLVIDNQHYYQLLADSYKLQRLMDYHVDTLWDGYEGAMNDEQGDPG